MGSFIGVQCCHSVLANCFSFMAFKLTNGDGKNKEPKLNKNYH